MTQDLVNRLNAQVSDQIHGPAREKILSQFEGSPDAETMAEVTYRIVIDVDSQANSRGAPLGIDVLMGVATETIDTLIEMLQAMGVTLNEDEMREETLIRVVMLHGESVKDDPEEKAAAQELLAQLTDDGTIQGAMNHIGEKADKTPEEIMAAGQQMAGPQQNPLAAGVQQGLMNQGQVL